MTTDTILDFRFWILDWRIPYQLTVPETEILQVQTKMVLGVEQLSSNVCGRGSAGLRSLPFH